MNGARFLARILHRRRLLEAEKGGGSREEVEACKQPESISVRCLVALVARILIINVLERTEGEVVDRRSRRLMGVCAS